MDLSCFRRLPALLNLLRSTVWVRALPSSSHFTSAFAGPGGELGLRLESSEGPLAPRLEPSLLAGMSRAFPGKGSSPEGAAAVSSLEPESPAIVAFASSMGVRGGLLARLCFPAGSSRPLSTRSLLSCSPWALRPASLCSLRPPSTWSFRLGTLWSFRTPPPCSRRSAPACSFQLVSAWSLLGCSRCSLRNEASPASPVLGSPPSSFGSLVAFPPSLPPDRGKCLGLQPDNKPASRFMSWSRGFSTESWLGPTGSCFAEWWGGATWGAAPPLSFELGAAALA
mmetsp:Transcript_30142/g.85096  ORF Transcript_30142/g.85096 Transcript_30142/m.85096 type:complete len:282 (-) Transcript_30142:1290-2135(-)